MQIHELNNFTGTLGSGAYLAVDDGNDTGKLSTQQLLAATEARIDNIIAGPAPSAEEIVDARLGDDGVTYPSLGDAIRDQVGDLKSDIISVSNAVEDEALQTHQNLDRYYFYQGQLQILGTGYNVYWYALNKGKTYKIKVSREVQYAFVNSLAAGTQLNGTSLVGTDSRYFTNDDNYTFLVVNGNYPDGVDPDPKVYEVNSKLEYADSNIALLNDSNFSVTDITPNAKQGGVYGGKIDPIDNRYQLYIFPIEPKNKYILHSEQPTELFYSKSQEYGADVFELTAINGGYYVVEDYNDDYSYLAAYSKSEIISGENVLTLKQYTDKNETLVLDFTNQLSFTNGYVIVAKEDSPDFGGTYENSDTSISDFIDVSTCKSIRISVSAFTNGSAIAGLVFYDDNKVAIKGFRALYQASINNEAFSLLVPNGCKYCRTTILSDLSTYNSPVCQLVNYKDRLLGKADLINAIISNDYEQMIIRVAAADATSYEKSLASYICDGINDEVEIQKALSAISECGEVWLSSGTFNIDSFSSINGKRIAIPLTKNPYDGSWEKTIKGAGWTYGGVTKIIVSSQALSNLGSDVGSVFSDPYFRYGRFSSFKNFQVFCADNQHKYTVIDNSVFSGGKIERVQVSAVPEAIANSPSIPMPVENCVGITGYCGDDSGILNIMENSFATGFYEGFRLGGEHLVCTQLNARYNYYSYTFGNYDWYIGTQSHPITLINCCDEHSAKLPKFVRNGNFDAENQKAMQQIDLIGYNMELFVPENFGGGLVAPAEEVVPDSFCGRVEFTAYGVSNVANELTEYPLTTNQKHVKFFADGSGHNFKTYNMVHKQGGTTSERQNYTPTYMQEYYDTDLHKKLIYDGSAWVDMNGNVV